MSIKEENLKKLEDLEKRLKENFRWVRSSGLEQSQDAIKRLRDLRQLVMSLSVAIVSILFPLILLEFEKLEAKIFFMGSLGLFCFVVLYGIFYLARPAIREVLQIPKVAEHHAEKTTKMIKEIKEIKRMEDNDKAVKRFKRLKEKYSELDEEVKASWLQKISVKLEPWVYFLSFVVAFILLVLGLFLNL